MSSSGKYKRISTTRIIGFKDSGPQSMPEDLRKDWNPNFKPADSLEGVKRLKEWRSYQSSEKGWRFAFPAWPWVIDWFSGKIMGRPGWNRYARLIASVYDHRGRAAKFTKGVFQTRDRKQGIGEVIKTMASMWLIRAAPEMAETLFMVVCHSPDKPVPRSLRSRMVSLLIDVGVIAEEERTLFLEGLVTNDVVDVVEAMEKMGDAENQTPDLHGHGTVGEVDGGVHPRERGDYYRQAAIEGGKPVRRMYDPRRKRDDGAGGTGRDSGDGGDSTTPPR